MLLEKGAISTMKKKYVFVGRGLSHVGGQEFSQFGQRAEFTDDFAREVILGGAAFITLEDYESLEIDPEHVARYFNESYLGEIPNELDSKRCEAEDLFRRNKAEFEAR